MTIKAHCMGMEFPKRDTDSPNVEWVSQVPYIHSCPLCGGPHATKREASLCWAGLPSEADLELVAEVTEYRNFVAMNLNEVVFDPTTEDCERILRESVLPSAADLDAVAEEQRVKEKTGG